MWPHVNISQICAWPLIHFCQHRVINGFIFIHFCFLSTNRAHEQIQCFQDWRGQHRPNEKQGPCLWLWALVKYINQKNIHKEARMKTITLDDLLWGIYFFFHLMCGCEGNVSNGKHAKTQWGKLLNPSTVTLRTAKAESFPHFRTSVFFSSDFVLRMCGKTQFHEMFSLTVEKQRFGKM